MNCEELHNDAYDYAEKTLTAARRAEYEAHAAECPDCRTFMAVCLEIRCREFTEFLDDYLDDALQPERRAVFDRHLAICPDCEKYLASYRATRELAIQAEREDVPAVEMPDELIRAILRARKES